jgi:2-keto-myo-inositol isomerase
MKTCINGSTTMPYSLEEDIRVASEIGFEGIEIWTEYWPQFRCSKLDDYLKKHDVSQLKRLLDENGIKPAALCPYAVTYENIEKTLVEIKRGAKIASKIDCPSLLIYPTLPKKEISRESAIKIITDTLKKYADIANPYGVKLAFEPVGRHPFVPGPREALEIIKNSGRENIGLAMDLFHFYRSNVTMEDIESMPMDNILIVHVDDCENRPIKDLKEEHRVYPGLGIMPVKEYLKILKNGGYSGFLSVELFREEYWKRPIKEIMERSFEKLRNVLAE